jgi:para-nitrobenzyl esterase
VFGESAGGGSILHLLGSPASSGLIRRAIVQSGATTLTLSADQTGEVAERVRQALRSAGVADAREAPVGQLLSAQARVAADMLPVLGAMAFHPAIDGATVVGPPVDAVGASDVPLLIGTTRDELNMYADPSASPLAPDHLVRRAARYLPRYGVSDPQPVLAAYADLPASAAWATMRTDAEMWLPAVAVAESNAAPTFAYRFDWPAAPPKEWLGACHAIDIPFTFGTFGEAGWADFVGWAQRPEEADALCGRLQQAWAAFAATGDPSTTDVWPVYDADRRATMILDSDSGLIDDPRADVRRAWDAGAAADSAAS